MLTITEQLDVPYANVDGTPITLDVYAPDDVSAPTVLYVHGGAFEFGDKRAGADTRLRGLAQHGLVVVSINYRLAPAVTYPAPIHDVKAAIRFVRARGAELDIRAERLGLLGASAGGYLAAMAAFTAGNEKFEGTVNDYREHSSAVQAVSLWFTPADLRATARRSPLEKELLPFSFERSLLGVEVSQADELAAEASPINWVKTGAAPLLLEHGDSDRVVPPSESSALHDAVVRAGGSSTMVVIGGAGHEDPRFDSDANLGLVAAWFRSQLSGPDPSPSAHQQRSKA